MCLLWHALDETNNNVHLKPVGMRTAPVQDPSQMRSSKTFEPEGKVQVAARVDDLAFGQNVSDTIQAELKGIIQTP